MAFIKLLATKMVKNSFGMAGNDIRIGVEILIRASLTNEFAMASGLYFDNDSQQFGSTHPDALNPKKSEEIVSIIEEDLTELRVSI